ncbi:TetR family transcriptional regulator [Nakamurella antarctica]|uniref:TetR family transcriptional regulator n=1 Tax=Nakamurella antarctica TaxID=1902245 RepID=A0A3G8ZMA1_9ACTN|nr:TetR family transcriptional regulator [Nakamurella antarctica]AZI57975.1 TetR family transcriptional regulator [Nakamurella antarctica]
MQPRVGPASLAATSAQQGTSRSEPGGTRQEQKERTRETIMASALTLSQTYGFAQISLRQVAVQAGVVPTAFYRHFESMENLGLVLVEQSFSTLRAMIRDAQRNPSVFENIINASAEVLVEAVKNNKAHFAFVARERLGGTAAIRQAIAHELNQFSTELAIMLGRLPHISRWAADDVQMVAQLFVRNMVSKAEDVTEIPDGRTDLEERIKESARREMRLIVIGFKEWRS